MADRTISPSDAAPSATATAQVELPITGMTCASCANRIERKLNKLDGVTATVNYATEKATVEYDAGHGRARAAARRGRGGGLQGHAARSRRGRLRRRGRRPGRGSTSSRRCARGCSCRCRWR